MRRVKKLHFTASFFFLALLQVLPFWQTAMGRIKPDLLLSGVLFFALFFGQRVGLVSGIIAGAIKDVFSGAYIFSNLFSMGIVGCIAGVYKNKLNIQQPLVQGLMTFAASGLAFLFFHLFAQLFTHMPPLWQSFFYTALPTAFSSALAAPLIFLILKRTYKY